MRGSHRSSVIKVVEYIIKSGYKPSIIGMKGKSLYLEVRKRGKIEWNVSESD